MKVVPDNYGVGFTDGAFDSMEAGLSKTLDTFVKCPCCNKNIKVTLPELMITDRFERLIDNYYNELLKKMAAENYELRLRLERKEGADQCPTS